MRKPESDSGYENQFRNSDLSDSEIPDYHYPDRCTVVAISSCTHDTNGTLRTLAKHLVRRYKLFVSLDTRIGHFEPSCSCFPITGQVLAKSPGVGPFQSYG